MRKKSIYKKIVASILLILPCFINAQDSSPSFQKGNVIISVGYGFPNLAKSSAKVFLKAATKELSDVKGISDITVTGMGPLHIKAEYGLNKIVSVGLSFNYVAIASKLPYVATVNGVDQSFTETARYNSFSALARLNLHFATSERFDPYIGVGVGYRGALWSISSDQAGFIGLKLPGFVPIGAEATLGARYYVTKNIGIYSELGFGKSIIQAGLVAKFN